MKHKIFMICIALLMFIIGYGQVYIAAPVGVYGYINSPVTNIATVTTNGLISNGNITVGTGGKWDFCGNIVSVDKGNGNSPNNVGRSEAVNFIDSGSYNNAANMAGATGFIIDGYAGTANKAGAFVLPLGIANNAFPVTVPGGKIVTAAYFGGTGTTENKALTDYPGVTPTEYSAYIDMPNGTSSGNYVFSSPLIPNKNSIYYLLTSNNTSSAGTSASKTQYSLLSRNGTFSSGNNYTTAAAYLSSLSATQVYFSISSRAVPASQARVSVLASSCTATLSWLPETEIGINYYEVGYSSDGINFVAAPRVQTKYNATVAGRYITTEIGYSYTYGSLKSGPNYFRLKTVDVNNTISYSKIVSVNGLSGCSARTPVQFWPNPLHEVLNIQGLISGSNIMIYAANGQKVGSYTAVASTMRINMNRFTSGAYIIKVQAPDGFTTTATLFRQ